MRLIALAAPLLCVGFATSPLSAHDYRLGSIRIDHPWSRATPPVTPVAGGYMSLLNESSALDRLVSVTSPLADRVEIHESTVVDGVARMRPLPDGLALPPRSTVDLKPGAAHIMFFKPNQPLTPGGQFPATLTFEKAGAIDVVFSVQAMGADGHAGHEESPR